MTLPAKIYRTASKFVVNGSVNSGGKLVTTVEDCCCKHCYDVFYYFCESRTVSYSHTECVDDNTRIDSVWQWDGLGGHYYLNRKGAACTGGGIDAGDCTPNETLPDPPAETPECTRCYAFWVYDCPSGTLVYDGSLCCTAAGESVCTGGNPQNEWFWNGSVYEYIQNIVWCMSIPDYTCEDGDGNPIQAPPDLPSDTSHCTNPNTCYDTWHWDCATGGFTHISVTCLSSPPTGAGTWTYVSGTTYEYIAIGGACPDESCTASTTPPDPPADLSSCQAWKRIVPCGGGDPLDVGVGRADWDSFPAVFKWGDTCGSLGDVTYTLPSVLITADEVSDVTGCDDEPCTGVPPPTPCGDVHCIHIDIYDADGNFQYSLDKDDHLTHAGCEYWAPDVEEGDPSCFSTSGAFNGWTVSTADGFFGTASGDATVFPASGLIWAEGPFGGHTSGWYAVVTVVPC